MDENEFNKLCKLCRISFTDDEKKELMGSIENVLEYVEQLNEVDTDGVAPCFTVNETLKSVLREDVPEAPLSCELFLKDAPSHVGGMIRVPPVLKQ